MVKYSSQKIVIFAVCKKFYLDGKVCKFLKIAFPNYQDAVDWVNDRRNVNIAKSYEYVIEEMPAMMRG